MKKYISSILALTISCGVCALPAYAKGAGAENIEIRVNKDNASLYWTKVLFNQIIQVFNGTMFCPLIKAVFF